MRRCSTIVAVAALLVACSGNPEPELVTPIDELDVAVPTDEGDAPPLDPEPEPAPEPEPESEPAPEPDEVELFAVPDEINASYIEAVLDRMHEGLVPGIRSSTDTGAFTPELESALADVYASELVEFEIEGWDRQLARDPDGDLIVLAERPEARRHQVVQPVVLSDECVIALVDVDVGPWYGRSDLELLRNLVVLVEARPAPPVNPTPWRVDSDALHEDDDIPDWALERCA